MSEPFTLPEGYRELSRDEIRTELLELDFSRRGTMQRRADFLSEDHAAEGRDLLHDAIYRALTSRTCPERITAEQFLGGIMRSIASTARRRRELNQGRAVSLPIDVVSEQLAMGAYTVQSPEDVIETERVRQICADFIAQLAADSATQAALIDGIGLDLRGEALAHHIGIAPRELATARRALKRRTQRLWPVLEKNLFGPVTPASPPAG